MSKKQKLELTWISKDARLQIEPRILLEDAEMSYHAPHRVAVSEIFHNCCIVRDKRIDELQNQPHRHVAVQSLLNCEWRL